MDFKKYINKGTFSTYQEILFVALKALDEIPLTKTEREQKEIFAKEQAWIDYKAGRSVYDEESARLDELFWDDADDELGSTDIPLAKRRYLRDFAYDKGHSAGYSEVFAHYQNIIDLYRKLEAAK
jgi:hypothetical protein